MKPNIILIVIDTLREDYSKILDSVFEKYGFKKYENVLAPSSWTIPSHASMLTGLYPKDHGAHATSNIKLPNIKLKKVGALLTFDLKKEGYTNYLFSANPSISPNFGFKFFDKVFNYNYFTQIIKLNMKEILYLINLKESKVGKQYYFTILRNKPFLFLKLLFRKLLFPIVREIIRWPYNKGIIKITKEISKTNFSKPHFTLINLMEVHEPYIKSKNFEYIKNFEKLDVKYINIAKRSYLLHINYLREYIKNMLNIFKKFRNTIIIIVSDHGQLFGEHNFIDHATFLWRELTYVPLWIYLSKDIKFIKARKEKVISLVNLKRLIIKLVNTNTFDENLLYSNVAFSEAYGVHENILMIPKGVYAKKRFEIMNKQRVAVLIAGKYAIYNLSDRKFEELDKGLNKKEVIAYLKKFYLNKI